jgi:hypothetical protein
LEYIEIYKIGLNLIRFADWFKHLTDFGNRGLGFGVWGLGFGVWGLGFGV